MKRFRIITLGCKVNQCETAAISHLLQSTGLEPAQAQSEPDVVVINTCTVTGRAAMQSRQAVRKAVRNHPGAKIVVTGCYAQTAAPEVQAIDGVDLIVGHGDKLRMAALLSRLQVSGPSSDLPSVIAGQTYPFETLPSVAREERTRAFLKIQDGCNTRCTYCIVPYARGNSRSMPAADVLRHMGQLGREGLREVVLTGIHLGAYGADLDPKTDLTELLTALVALAPVDRIRLSSIEPTEVDERIIRLVSASRGFICRHLHIPLQSGDNAILRKMGRPYTREQFAGVIHAIHAQIPDVAIGVDVMAGFPGETDEAFSNSFNLIAALPITHLHVFPFSPRKGTSAAAFKEKVPERITKERCRLLRELGEAKRIAFYKTLVGKDLKVIVESIGAKGTFAKGLSDNYVPIAIRDATVAKNTLSTVRIAYIENGIAVGELTRGGSEA